MKLQTHKKHIKYNYKQLKLTYYDILYDYKRINASEHETNKSLSKICFNKTRMHWKDT
jgi:hypothetical protein